jgi:LysR family glycine cleavage system transcriptional activator
MNALRAFEAVSRLGSVSKAAEELCVSQGAVSQQLRNLEDHLDREKARLTLLSSNGH